MEIHLSNWILNGKWFRRVSFRLRPIGKCRQWRHVRQNPFGKSNKNYKMATLDESPSLYLGQPWSIWAHKVEGKHKDSEFRYFSSLFKNPGYVLAQSGPDYIEKFWQHVFGSDVSWCWLQNCHNFLLIFLSDSTTNESESKHHGNNTDTMKLRKEGWFWYIWWY